MRMEWHLPFVLLLVILQATHSYAADDPEAAAVVDDDILVGDAEEDLLQAEEKPAFPDESTPPMRKDAEVEVVASFPSLIPGKLDLYAAKDRMFFTFHPKQGVDLTHKLCEWKPREGRYLPYPNNDYQETEFVSPLGVRVDNIRGWLLVLDSGNHGEIPPKLFVFDLNTDKLVRKYEFPSDVAGVGSDLYDLVIDKMSRFVYVADSNIQGASPGIIVVDLHIWRSKRILNNHESVKPKSVVPSVNGKAYDMPWEAGVSSITLDENGDNIYFASTLEDKLFALPSRILRKQGVTNKEIERAVFAAGQKTVTESIVTDVDGKVYLTDFEHSSIAVIDPANAWSITTLVQNEKLLRWPHGLAIANGYLYASCSAFHHVIDGDLRKKGPFHIVRVKLTTDTSTDNEL